MKLIAALSFACLCAFLLPAVAHPAGDAKKGKEVFESLTCVDCHKDGGNSVTPSKPLKGESFAQKYKEDRKIEKVIREGIPGASMPSFGPDVISEEQMKDLIAYLRSLTPAPSKDNCTKGKKVNSKSQTGGDSKKSDPNKRDSNKSK